MSTALGFSGDMSHCSVLALEDPGFSQELLCCHYDLKMFCKTAYKSVLLNIIENIKCSCHGNEKQNSESFFNYDANLTSVITMELKFIYLFIYFFAMLISLYDVISCYVISVKNFREILRYFF